MPYVPMIPLIADGTPVDQAVTNVPLRAIASNVDYLKGLIDQIQAGAALRLLARPADPTITALLVPVWFNPAAGRFERAQAKLVQNADGSYSTHPSAQVWGVVGRVNAPGSIDVVVWGTISAVPTSAVADLPALAGDYYLSSALPGRVVATPPSLTVEVFRYDGAGTVLVRPDRADFSLRHSHANFSLTCRPAGTHVPPASGATHAITSANPALPGWLPASDASFNGLAPAGAKFGYNIAADGNLSAAWPPASPNQVVIDWDKGLSQNSFYDSIPTGPGTPCIVDAAGIWWTSNCYGDVPWPVNLTTPSTASLSLAILCPRHLQMRMRAWFTKPVFDTTSYLVTSLQTADNRVKIVCPGTGLTATSGPLEVDLDLTRILTATGDYGRTALKSFDGHGFTAGPVVSGLYTTATNLSLTGDSSWPLSGAPGAPTVYGGQVQIATTGGSAISLPVRVTRVDGADNGNYQNLMYIALPAGSASGTRNSVVVPSTLRLNSPTLALVLTLFGQVAGTFPALTVTARRIPRPAALFTDHPAVPTSSAEFSVAVTTNATLTGIQYLVVQTTPFAVLPGDIVFFTVSRGASDAYTGDVGILNVDAVVSGS